MDFVDYFKFLLDNNFNELDEKLKECLEIKKLPKRSDDQIIEGVLATSPKDLENKRKDKNYYICNALCLLNTIRKIFSVDLYNILCLENTPRIVKYNYEHILKWMLLDYMELCNLFNNNLKEDFKYRSNFDSRYIHFMSIHQVLRQTLFGQVSINSFADMEISSSIAVIRQLVELRIRRAFGVLSYIEKDSGKLLPLDLSSLFEILRTYKEEIIFPLKLENIERIYKWSNMYVHSGKNELSWIPYFLENVLKTFSFGEMNENGWDVKNGIATSNQVIQKIHSELLNDKGDLDIFSCRLECKIKDSDAQ